MIEFENHITIHRAVEDVFEFATDLTKVPWWNYYVIDVTPTSQNPGTVGATYHQVRKTDQQDLRIAKIDPNRFFKVETIPPSSPEFSRNMVFSGDGNSTHLIDHWQLKLYLPSFLERISAQKVRQGVGENLVKLKILLEEGQVTLQDGRIFTRR